MVLICYFFFNDTATTEIYTLSLHDALPISGQGLRPARELPSHRLAGTRPDATHTVRRAWASPGFSGGGVDRKSTRLNSSHANISYAVFCLKKKKYFLAHISISSLTFILRTS